MKKILIVSAIVVLVVAGIFIFRKPDTGDETIKIGAALGLTGDASSWGEMSLKGAQLAVDELNEKNGIKGKKVELVVEDTTSSAKGSIAAVQKLISVENTDAILGPTWLDVYQGAQGVVSGKNIVLVSPDAGVEAVNTPQVYPNAFSSWYRSQPKAELLMSFLEKQNVQKVAVILQNDSYYVDLGKRLSQEAGRRGIQITRVEMINGGDADFKTLLTKIKADAPDGVFVALYDQKATDVFFKNRSQVAPTLPVFSDEFGQDYVDNPEYASFINGMYFFSATRQDDSFEKAFKATYEGLTPKFGASNSYDTIMMLAEALENQPDDLAGYMKSHMFKTVTFGDMKFDAINGVETQNETYVMKQIKDGVVTLLR